VLKAMFRPMFVALLCAVTLGASAVAVHRRDRPPEPAAMTALSAEAGCSASRAGMATLSVSWPGARAAVAQSRLDITAHKGGFEKGLFVTLDRIEPGARTRIPSATRLPVSFFRTALALTATSVAADPAGSVRVELEGVQPGLYYFVRVGASTASAPVEPCINEGDEPRRRQ
jgi:hypothetical protein